MNLRKGCLLGLSFLCLFIHGSCGDSGAPNPPPGGKICQGSLSLPPLPSEPGTFSGILFTPVGSHFPNSNLVDVEFLPGQNGDAALIGKDGTIYYAKNDFSFLIEPDPFQVEDDGEQGMLNVAADPDYANNCFLYFYFTPTGGGINRVVRGTVTYDGSVFTVTDRQLIIEFSKSGPNNNPDPGANHNGGSLLFDGDKLLMGVGDGGGGGSTNTTANIAQRGNTRLGKILRIVPSRTDGSGGFTLPPEGNDTPGGDLPEIYARGVRNPFTLAKGNGVIFIGDVGEGSFEEIDMITQAGQNFGWPQVEGPGGAPTFVDPIGGYNHGADLTARDTEDPEDNPTGPISLLLGNFYAGPRYGGFLTNTLIYGDFFHAFVRGLVLDGANQVVSDNHLGHQGGLTGLHQSPDGFLYGVSLGGSDQILRVDLRP